MITPYLAGYIDPAFFCVFSDNVQLCSDNGFGSITMWDDFYRAMCLMLVFEGLLPFLAPARWRQMVSSLSDADDRTLRIVGLGCMLTGAGLLFLVNRG